MPGLMAFMPGIGEVFHGVTEAPCATVVATMAAITAATIVL
jgi:hypothetical protein